MKKILILIIISLTAFVAFAEEKALSLEEAIKIGLKNNFQVQIVREEVKISENNNSWGAAGRYPTVSANASLNNSYTDTPSQMNPDERVGDGSTMYNFSLDASWVLFSGFRVKFTKDKLALLEKQGKGDAESVMEETVRDIILAYYGVRLEQEKLTVMEEMKKLSKDRYDREMEKKKFGASTTYILLQYKTAMLQDEANYLSQHNKVASAMRELNRLLGNIIEVGYKLTDEFKVPLEEFQLETLKAGMFANNRSLQTLEIQQRIMKKEVSVQKSGLWPRLSLNSGVQGNTMVGNTTYTGYANIGLSYNIYNGGNTKLAITNARINERMGELRLEETRISLENRLSDTLALYNTRKQLLNVSDEQLKSASLSLELSEEKLNTGAIDSFNYRDVQLSYLNAAVNRLQSIYNLMNSKTNLMVITGGLQFN